MKPEFFRNSELYEAERSANASGTGPYINLRAAFLGLITAADREGRFKWRPAELKLDALPYDPIDFGAVLALLASGPSPYIVRYEVDGKAYGYIPGFLTHQRPKFDEAQSLLPAPLESSSNRPTIGGQSAQGKERKGKERKEGNAVEAEGFNDFYSLYPRKQAKTKAASAWAKLKPSAALQETILADVRRNMSCQEWLNEGGRFIPLPSSYLNGRRWEDQGVTLPKQPVGPDPKTAAFLASRNGVAA